MKNFGVTGGIGSGKSYICRIIQDMGYPVFYSDDESKRIINGDKFIKDYPIPYECVIKGDGKYYNIAGASVLVKVSKDNEMLRLHEEYDMYSWNTNKSYINKKHKEAVQKYGLSPYHRKSYNVSF